MGPAASILLLLGSVPQAAASTAPDAATCIAAQGAPAPCVDVLILAADAALRKADHDAAQQFARRAIAIEEARSAAPSLALGQAYNMLAVSMPGADAARAVPFYRKAIAIYDALPGEGVDKRIALYNLGVALRDQGDLPAAEAAFQRAITVAQAIDEKSGAHLALVALGNLYYAGGRNAEADDAYRQALGIAVELWGLEGVETARTYRSIGLNLAAQARYDEAIPLFRRALAVFTATYGDQHRRTALAYGDLAGALLAKGAWAEAAAAFERAIAAQTRLLGADHPETIALTFSLGQVRWEQDRGAGLRTMRAALAQAERVGPGASVRLASQRKQLAMYLHLDGAHVAEARLARAALSAYLRAVAPTDAGAIGALAEYGLMMQRHGQKAEAVAYHRAAVARLTERLKDASRDAPLLDERRRKGSYYRYFIAALWSAQS